VVALQLAGVIGTGTEGMVVQNRIYERVFDEEWVRRNAPSDSVIV